MGICVWILLCTLMKIEICISIFVPNIWGWKHIYKTQHFQFYPKIHEWKWQKEKVKGLQYKCKLMEVVGSWRQRQVRLEPSYSFFRSLKAKVIVNQKLLFIFNTRKNGTFGTQWQSLISSRRKGVWRVTKINRNN